MPLCFWATQTAVAKVHIGAGRSWEYLKPYISLVTAVTAIQNAYQAYVRYESYLDRKTHYEISLETLTQSLEAFELQMQMHMLESYMAIAMLYLCDKDDFVYSVSGSCWIPHWDDG